MPKGIVTNPTGRGGFRKGESGNPTGRRARPKGGDYDSILGKTRQALGDDGPAPEVERAANGRFPKGVSGNPGGRPKGVAQVAEAARVHTLEAIARLAYLMHHAESEQAQAQAASALLDRAWGKPQQTIDQNINDSRPTPAELKPDMPNPLAGLRQRIIAESEMKGSGAGLERDDGQASTIRN